MTKLLELSNINKRYQKVNDEITALKDISFSLNDQEIIAIVGSSGCGKSTILSIIAEIISFSTGTIIKSNQFYCGYMLQSDALFPWLTVWDNIMLGVKIKDGQNIYQYHEEGLKLLKKYNLEDFKDKFPSDLSGGMRQRVALIRTILLKPNVLLLDEPFSALDYQTRISIAKDVKKIIKERKMAAIIVTHDIAEALTFANRIIILSKRPAVIKKELIIENNDDDFRNSSLFKTYYDEIWKELDHVI